MGSGSFNTTKYYQSATNYQKQTISNLFQQSTVKSEFNPLHITTRQSCQSPEHPHPTSIIIACDVTGSIGKIPENLLKGGLGKIMKSLLKISSISNPQIMFAAIGDTECDQAPLQVTQFESDNRIEAQLKNLYLEGGGGGNYIESYHSIWCFAAYKTQLDVWKEGRKGILFTMGDEMMPERLKADHIRKFIDKDYTGPDLFTSELIKKTTEKYDVFHLIVQDTSTYTQIGGEKVNQCWKKYLGERAIIVTKYNDIPQKIISTVQTLCEYSMTATPFLPKPKKASLESLVAKDMVHVGLFSHPSTHAPHSSDALTKDQDNIPHLFICPISHEIMKSPVIAEDGYTYENSSILAWFKNNTTSPMTNTLIGKILIPNHSLKSEIEQWHHKQQNAAPILAMAAPT